MSEERGVRNFAGGGAILSAGWYGLVSDRGTELLWRVEVEGEVWEALFAKAQHVRGPLHQAAAHLSGTLLFHGNLHGLVHLQVYSISETDG